MAMRKLTFSRPVPRVSFRQGVQGAVPSKSRSIVTGLIKLSDPEFWYVILLVAVLTPSVRVEYGKASGGGHYSRQKRTFDASCDQNTVEKAVIALPLLREAKPRIEVARTASCQPGERVMMLACTPQFWVRSTGSRPWESSGLNL